MTKAENKNFYKDILFIGLPITLQSIFAASFSVIDQLMVGQLGSVEIAAGGLAGKFASLFMTTVTAVSSGASILISQYYGKKDSNGINKSFSLNLFFSVFITILFCGAALLMPNNIMGLYTTDADTCSAAAQYLVIVAFGFLPYSLTLMMSTQLRSVGYSRYPMYAGIASVVINIIGNYLLIFGNFGFPQMGLNGAAAATAISKFCETIIILFLFLHYKRKEKFPLKIMIKPEKDFLSKTLIILAPLLITEFAWSLGENIYAAIYGRIGTDACAAMTLTGPVQSLLIGLFTGLSAAAGVLIGNRLGRNDFEAAYKDSRKFISLAFCGSIIISIVLVLCSGFYTTLFNVNAEIQQTAVYILYVFAGFIFVKVLNMVLAGGILRSGGNTKYTMVIDLIGTWGFGIPLGLIASYVFNLPIYFVYLILSLEECVRLILGFIVFARKRWMKNIT